MKKSPKHGITIIAADGKTKIKFLPDDIKAIATLFWSKNKYQTKFIGSRCKYNNFNDIPSDPETGLWLDASCFSINPAAFTIAITNQIGIRKKNLVFDPDSNGQIWNQPAYGYKMGFYNIITGNSCEGMSCSIITIEDVKNTSDDNSDKYLKFLLKNKGPNTKFFAGMTMKMDFIFENDPLHEDKILTDNKTTKHYQYILELDENNKIVGGEWINNSHPIFIWSFDEHEKINTEETIDGSMSSLKNIHLSAIKASQEGSVLNSVVNYLIKESIK